MKDGGLSLRASRDGHRAEGELAVRKTGSADMEKSLAPS